MADISGFDLFCRKRSRGNPVNPALPQPGGSAAPPPHQPSPGGSASACHLSGMTALARQLPVPIPASSAQDPADQRLGEIRGRVFAADGEYPLAKATLSLRSTGAPPQDRPRTVRTDGRGEYAFEDLEAGKYVLRARRSGYIPKNYGQKTSHSFRREGVGTSLSVGSGQVLDGVDFHVSMPVRGEARTRRWPV